MSTATVVKRGRAAVYEASLLKAKRVRRTKAEIEAVLDAIRNILSGQEGQITIRHLFYRLTGLGLIPKTEPAYQGLIQHLSKWRRSGEIAWSAFADNTRWHIHEQKFDSAEEALRNTVATYRRNLWSTQPSYVEIWVEKDAIASIVADKAGAFGVPVFVCRGFASLSSMYAAAETFKAAIAAGKAVRIYHLGDYDPSGLAAGLSIEKALREDFHIEIEFERIAVTREQIKRLELPTRPVKGSDSRAARWGGGDECVELDTIEPAELQLMVERAIIQNIDYHQWTALQKAEALERTSLESFFAKWKRGK